MIYLNSRFTPFKGTKTKLKTTLNYKSYHKKQNIKIA